MGWNDDDDDTDSTLLRVGRSAVTFSDMEGFVHELESRPHGRLVSDLPSLLGLPSSKFDLCVMVLRRRFRSGSASERAEILAGLQGAADQGDAEVAERAKALVARL